MIHYILMLSHVLLHIVSYDIWYYFSHILLHKKFLYKMIHKDHHLIDYKLMTFSHAYVAHFTETPFQSIGVLFPLVFVKFNIQALLNVFVLINVRSMLKHDNRFVWLIGNHHILHHKHPKHNFGEYWLDKLFSTHYPNENEYIKGLICI